MTKGHVLIVDDEKDILSSLKVILTDEGYEVSTSTDGEDAIRIIQSDTPDVVLLDIWITGMDGIQILKAVKEQRASIEVIMMSGHGTIDTAVKATKMGAYDFIEKPFSLENVLMTVNNAIKQQRASIEYSELRRMMARESKIIGEHPIKESMFHVSHDKLTSITTEKEQYKDVKRLPNRTLKRSVVVCGQGLHSGLKTGLILSPLPPYNGIVFEDISTGERVPAHLDYIESTDYATTLKKGQIIVRTIEHIMAVLHMYRITNLLIKVGDEVPIMDGSAKDFCQLIENGGIEQQEGYINELIVDKKYTIQSENRYISIEPSDEFIIDYFLDYPLPVGIQKYSFTAKSSKDFKKNIAPARTFGFLKDVEKLEEMGLASGGRLSNFILVDNEKVINAPLRFPDEFVRHKILDILGDIYLLGYPIRGYIKARMTGHRDNIKLLNILKQNLLQQ